MLMFVGYIWAKTSGFNKTSSFNKTSGSEPTLTLRIFVEAKIIPSCRVAYKSCYKADMSSVGFES